MDKPIICCNNHLNGARRAFDDNYRPAMLMAFPLFSSWQDPGGSKDPQTGGAGTGSLCQRHRPGADRGQAVQPRGEHTEELSHTQCILCCILKLTWEYVRAKYTIYCL